MTRGRAAVARGGPCYDRPVSTARRLHHTYEEYLAAREVSELRLAYLDSLQPGGLGPRGVAQLKRSYDLVAIDPDVGLWRIRFALENSQRLTPDLRSSVRNEALAMGSEGKSLSELKQMVATIRTAPEVHVVVR